MRCEQRLEQSETRSSLNKECKSDVSIVEKAQNSVKIILIANSPRECGMIVYGRNTVIIWPVMTMAIEEINLGIRAVDRQWNRTSMNARFPSAR